jgi:Putative membrane protein insertion efficiency factor
MEVHSRRYLFILSALLILWWLEGTTGKAIAGGVRETTATASHAEPEAKNTGAWLVSIFRDYISAVDGDRCPSVPSCSSFSVQAFNRHGFVMGWLMTVDRLIHEGKEETDVSPLVYANGRLKIYDPVENNDFWWPKPYEDPED